MQIYVWIEEKTGTTTISVGDKEITMTQYEAERLRDALTGAFQADMFRGMIGD